MKKLNFLAVRPYSLYQMLLIFIALKICFYLFLFLVYPQLEWIHWGTQNALRIKGDIEYDPFMIWDSAIYLKLAYNGYGANLAQFAFYPLFVYLIKLFSFGILNKKIVSFFLVTFLSIGFCVYFYNLVLDLWGRKVAFYSCLLCILFPTAFNLSLIMTESLFLFLLMGFLYHANKKNVYLSGLFAFMLPLSRGHGLLLFFGFSLYFALGLIKGKWKNHIARKLYITEILCFSIGLIALLLFQYFYSGDAFSFIKAQKLWIFNNSISNLWNFKHFFYYLVGSSKHFFWHNNSMFDKLFVYLHLLAIPLVLKKTNHFYFTLYLALFLIPSLMSQGGSFSRFSLMTFPFIAIGLSRMLYRQTVLLNGLCFFTFTIQFFLWYRYLAHGWIG